MFAHAADTADALLHVAAEHPGIVGFNIDLETGASTTQADTEAFAGFLGTVTRALRQVGAVVLWCWRAVVLGCWRAAVLAGGRLAGWCARCDRCSLPCAAAWAVACGVMYAVYYTGVPVTWRLSAGLGGVLRAVALLARCFRSMPRGGSPLT